MRTKNSQSHLLDTHVESLLIGGEIEGSLLPISTTAFVKF